MHLSFPLPQNTLTIKLVIVLIPLQTGPADRPSPSFVLLPLPNITVTTLGQSVSSVWRIRNVRWEPRGPQGRRRSFLPPDGGLFPIYMGLVVYSGCQIDWRIGIFDFWNCPICDGIPNPWKWVSPAVVVGIVEISTNGVGNGWKGSKTINIWIFNTCYDFLHSVPLEESRTRNGSIQSLVKKTFLFYGHCLFLALWYDSSKSNRGIKFSH